MEDIQLAEEKFSTLDHIPVGACVLRADFTVLFWNRCLEEWTSIPRSEILGTDISVRFPHLSQPKYVNRLKQIFMGGPPTIFSSQLHKFIIPCLLPDGQYRIQQTTVTAVPAAKLGLEAADAQLETIAENTQLDYPHCEIGDRQLFYALLAIQDVTDLTHGIQDLKSIRDKALEEIKERRRIEEALRQSEERYRLIVETLLEGIWVIDAEGNTTFVNHQMAAMLGYTVEEILGLPLLTFMDKESQKTAKSYIDRHRLAPESINSLQKHQDFKFRRQDGTDLWTIVSISPIFNSSSQYIGALGTITDITDRKRAEDALRLQTERERLMSLITYHIRQSLSLSNILNTTVQEVRQFLQTDRVSVVHFYPDWSGVVTVESVGADWKPILETKIDCSSFADDYLKFYQQGNIEALEDIYTATLSQFSVDLLSEFQVKASLVVPILQSNADSLHHRSDANLTILKNSQPSNRLWGLLIAHDCSNSRQWHLWEIDLLKQLATQVAIAIQQAELYEKLHSVNQELKRLATFDSLTHLFNRRRFDEYLNQEWRRLAREKGQLSLILCDIDFFKHYNDTYGHLAGDFCLQEVAAAIASVIKRPADLAARYGGEEFAVILPNTDAEGAALVAEEIRLKIKGLQINHAASDVSEFVTMSLGVACIVPFHHGTPVKLITAADKALYQAKAKGRDRVQIYEALW